MSDAAVDYFERDIARSIRYGAGVIGMHDRENLRSLPYLASGSAGVLYAMLRVLGIREAKSYPDLVDGFLAACSSNVYAFSGLLNGRAGICAALGASSCLGRRFVDETLVQLEMLSEHALSWGDSLQFPGENYLRLSADLGTGTAGVLAVVASVRDSQTYWIPIRGAAKILDAVSVEKPGLQEGGEIHE